MAMCDGTDFIGMEKQRDSRLLSPEVDGTWPYPWFQLQVFWVDQLCSLHLRKAKSQFLFHSAVPPAMAATSIHQPIFMFIPSVLPVLS